MTSTSRRPLYVHQFTGRTPRQLDLRAGQRVRIHLHASVAELDTIGAAIAAACLVLGEGREVAGGYVEHVLEEDGSPLRAAVVGGRRCFVERGGYVRVWDEVAGYYVLSSDAPSRAAVRRAYRAGRTAAL